MRSLHYPITLSDDFDMRAIERRARDRAHAFEGMRGLTLKVFLSTSIAQGAPRNLYAPFYVWSDAAAMADFLGGALFHAVTQSFGRPAAFDRPVLAFAIADRDVQPEIATIEEVAIDTQRPLLDAYGIEADAHRQEVSRPGLFATVSVLDSVRWTVSRVGLWRSAADASHVRGDAQRLNVLAVVGNAVQAQGGPSLAT
jgi:heme-degrading monooxygenase HmoA